MTILQFLALWTVANAGYAACVAPPDGAAQIAACKCGYPSVEDAFARSRAVFSGVVVEVYQVPTAPRIGSPDDIVVANGPQAVTLRVTTSWKGADRGETITVLDWFACGVGFRMGEEYLVYAGVDADGSLETSPCQRTRLITPASGTSDFRLPPTWEDVAVLDSIARRP